jgi:hypothetical protein
MFSQEDGMTLIPDGKRLVADYLRSHSSITALSARVVGKSPEDRSTPWIRVTQIDAQNAAGSLPEHLISYLLQFDCFVAPTEGHPQARTLAHTVRAIFSPPNTPLMAGGATVSGVRFVNEAELTDSNTEPATEYVALTAEAFIHG